MAETVTMDSNIASAPVMLLQMMTGYWLSKAVYVAAKLGIADLLSDGAASYDDLAKTTGTHAPSLYRLLRALASKGVFSEVMTGRFAVTPIGALLQTGGPNSMRALAIMYGEEQYRTWGDLLHSIQTGQPAFERKFGMDVFEYFHQNTAAGAVFNEAMTNWTTQVSAAVAATYDFSRFGTIVDVGGNQGILLAAILRNNPAGRGILFDLPHVVATAREQLTEAGVESRCEVLGGDFFTAVPPDGDAYLLSYVLHDWNDERCVAILAQCRRAIAASGTLLAIELVLPEGNEPSFGKLLDLHMLVMAGGRERTGAEYRVLLQAGGFVLTRVIPTPAGSSIIEATPG
jgi:hypothetical protein